MRRESHVRFCERLAVKPRRPTHQREIVMTYRITGLDPTPFRNLFGLSDEKLGRLNVKRFVADAKPGYPDRVELRDAEPRAGPPPTRPSMKRWRGSFPVFLLRSTSAWMAGAVRARRCFLSTISTSRRIRRTGRATPSSFARGPRRPTKGWTRRPSLRA